ncbi:DNA-binding MurR/RpiR family transcriptional regulator [Nakamurella sp. UYEF19]|uniref:MurR/RpiR family transcriptional regulator n=1 Tax=Nakamurella sp. UYEF19 TaxID=1756392 RepID=UPI00339A5598
MIATNGAPTTEILVSLRSLAPTLVPSLQRVAARILEDPGGVAAQTISELARAADTSESSVLRLCRQLHVAGYRDLRVALAAESGRERALSDNRQVGGDIGRTDDLESIIDSVTFADRQAIADTARTIDREALARAIALVVGARRIDIVGVGASAVVALDLQQKLHRIGLIAFTWSDTHAALTAAALLGSGDVMIGISHTGVTRDTEEAIVEAGRHGAKTIALTSVSRSPLARRVDVLLVTAARETTFRSGATSSRIAALSVVDVLFVAVAQQRYDATVSALEATRRAVIPRRFEQAEDLS